MSKIDGYGSLTREAESEMVVEALSRSMKLLKFQGSTGFAHARPRRVQGCIQPALPPSWGPGGAPEPCTYLGTKVQAFRRFSTDIIVVRRKGAVVHSEDHNILTLLV